MPNRSQIARFEQVVLPHLDAAYNLARWLTRDGDDAADIVQEASIRAFKSIDGYRGDNSRAWVLTIVRNTFYTWRQQSRAYREMASYSDELEETACAEADPETLHLHLADQQMLRQVIEALPLELREMIVLRELEELSYKEIALVTGIPLGTVMSRLSRARDRLQGELVGQSRKEATGGM